MQIVIDIPDKIYNRYINYTESYIDFMFIGTEEILVRAIRNGTPLPKGHGRLIDADELLKEKRCFEDFDGDTFNIIHEETVINASTIIEADKESDKDV